MGTHFDMRATRQFDNGKGNPDTFLENSKISRKDTLSVQT